MLNKELKERLAKIYELVKRGATDGERSAAKNALDKILAKHNIEGIDLDSIDKKEYFFTYTTEMEEGLLGRLCYHFLNIPIHDVAFKYAYKKRIGISLTRLNYITLECSYAYFRKHMKEQWNKTCADELKKKRKAKTKNARRKELQDLFFQRYIIASSLTNGLKVFTKEISDKERKDFNLLEDVEGGKYHTQVTNGLLLN